MALLVIGTPLKEDDMAPAARKFGRLFIAVMTVLVGVAMLVLPGPGLLTVALGLGLLGRELGWEWVARAEAWLFSWTDDVPTTLPRRGEG